MSNPNSVTYGYRRPVGYKQITSLATAVGLTLPNAPAGTQIGAAIIQNNTTGTVRWRDDGTAPTSTVGMLIPAGGELDYFGEMTAIQFVSASGSPILDISYYV